MTTHAEEAQAVSQADGATETVQAIEAHSQLVAKETAYLSQVLTHFHHQARYDSGLVRIITEAQAAVRRIEESTAALTLG